MSTTARNPKASKKTAIPPAGRKLSQREAIEQVNKQFAKALAKLAK
jgi:hypothetical protein